MKHLSIVVAAVLLLTACGNHDRNTFAPVANNAPVNPDEDLLVAAKALIDSADGYVELSETKKMSTKKANAKIDPLMKRVDSINHIMSLDGQARLREYRIARINALIDRKVERNNK